jgi:predicted nuclease of predicted toxin-antitoxin system
VRLLFDENLSALTAQWAADALAIDALDARAAGMAGKTDSEVRRFAIETDRILVTLAAQAQGSGSSWTSCRY